MRLKSDLTAGPTTQVPISTPFLPILNDLLLYLTLSLSPEVGMKPFLNQLFSINVLPISYGLEILGKVEFFPWTPTQEGVKDAVSGSSSDGHHLYFLINTSAASA